MRVSSSARQLHAVSARFTEFAPSHVQCLSNCFCSRLSRHSISTRAGKSLRHQLCEVLVLSSSFPERTEKSAREVCDPCGQIYVPCQGTSRSSHLCSRGQQCLREGADASTRAGRAVTGATAALRPSGARRSAPAASTWWDPTPRSLGESRNVQSCAKLCKAVKSCAKLCQAPLQKDKLRLGVLACHRLLKLLVPDGLS